MKRIPILADEDIEKVLQYITKYRCTPQRHVILRALFVVLANLGLRISEALAIRVCDWDYDRADITVRTLKQHPSKNGNGAGVEDTLPLDDVTREALQKATSLRHHEGAARKDRIFLMSRKVAYNIFQRLLHRAGILPIKLHALRHSAVTRWLEETGDLTFAMFMARHKNVATTAQYTHCRRLREQFLRVKAIGRRADT